MRQTQLKVIGRWIMNYKIMDAISPEGVQFQYLLVDDIWYAPLTEESPAYRAYLAWLEDPNAEITPPVL